MPGETRTFGTVVGPEGGASVQISRPLELWGRAFLPVSGHNTIARGTGRPARAPAYDVGVRLRLTDALSSEVFLSNALGNTGALAYVADREYPSIGAGVAFRPGAKLVQTFTDLVDGSDRVAAPHRALSAHSSTRGDRSVTLGGGMQGVVASAALSPVDQLEFTAFLDYPNGSIDEGELGGSGRVALLTARGGSPYSISIVAAASRTNTPMINLLSGSRDELERRGLEKGGFDFGDENIDEGRVYVIVGALPIERRIGARSTLHITPIVGLAQRSGTQIVGGVAGIDRSFAPSFAGSLSLGGDFGSKGNVLTRDGRDHVPVWTAAATWATRGMRSHGFALDAQLTNRVGD
jgi:hypothetical protein